MASDLYLKIWRCIKSTAVFIKWFSPILLCFILSCSRVWKGILGIRDLTKIRCGIRENAKHLDGIRDLTTTREAGFTKYLGTGCGILLPVCREFGKSSRPKKPLQRQKRINQASAKYQSKGLTYILNLLAFAEISLF